MKAFSILLFVLGCLLAGETLGESRELFVVSSNPQPDKLPTLGVWQDYVKKHDNYDTLLSASFPNVPQFLCDLWCFESQGIVFESARDLGHGQVELIHAWDAHDCDVVTIATPHQDALELVATLRPTSVSSSGQPEDYPPLNVCWQLRRAAGFSSKPDPYPEFFKRCFIFTERGQTFLSDTRRLPIPVRSASDERNNPPWVQMYAPESAPTDLRSTPTDWADYSPDRYRVPILGAVSRDRKYLAAIASGTESVICQAWHDCMHNNPSWLPSADGTSKQWRIMIYVMENDIDSLLARFQTDFPTVAPWNDSQSNSQDRP